MDGLKRRRCQSEFGNPTLVMLLEALPVELIADILGELDLHSLITASYLSRRLFLIASDPALNPWRRPILRNLSEHTYEPELKHLSVRTVVPRHNWVEILSLARPPFLLFEATLPNLKEAEWEECFKRRYLPSWRKWKKEGTWKEAFIKLLHRVWHRSVTSCTTDEAWTKFIVFNRNGSANEREAASRNFNPLTIFNEIKLENDLVHLETRRRVLLELADVRITAYGTLSRPKTTLTINPNAHILLHPPGIERGEVRRHTTRRRHVSNAEEYIQDYGVYPLMSVISVPTFLSQEYQMSTNTYARMQHPTPAPIHANYPFFTPGGNDRRWVGIPETEEGLHWVGSLMLIAQIIVPNNQPETDGSTTGRQQYASFCWNDLWTLAPWMEERITKRIDGPGLGN